ncbi:MAG: hypothetical protein CMJ48_01680 [Planctomycetaceae bacterium]|nr:hypothetical protein [Planctomycetaceae bacterium]
MRVGVIGLGPQGRRVVRVLSEMPQLELAAVVDRDEEALSTLALPASATRHRCAEEFWERGGCDLICIATNGPSHAALALEAMDAGARFVMVEKPMACTVADCERMRDEAIRRGVRLAVDHSRRHDPLYRWLRDQIRSGIWGEPRSVWMQQPGIGLGCRGTHAIDLVRFLTDSDVRSVTAWIDEPRGENPRGGEFVDPGGLLVLDMTQGLRGVICQIEDGAGPISVEIDLTACRIRLDERFGTVEIIERDLAVQPGPGRPPAYRSISAPDGYRAQLDMFQMVRGLLEELISDAPLECDSEHGIETIRVLVAAYISEQKEHSPVALASLSESERELLLSVT